jgi:hypothetical protein
MKEVFRSCDTARIGLYQSALEEAGICCFVRNETTQQALFGVAAAFFPLPEFFPTLCILNDEDYSVAMAILRELHADEPASESDWQCAHCGEKVPANFGICWNCGTPCA